MFLKPPSRVCTALSTDESSNYQCLPCENKDCKDGTYRTGTCEGTGNNFVCASQPTCPKDEYLDGATTMLQGKCKACDSTVCSPGTFRTGTCSGTVSPRRTCTHLFTSCSCYCVFVSRPPLVFLSIPCESSGSLILFQPAGLITTHTGSTNEFKCEPCMPASCAAGEERRGECSGTTITFACVPCKEGFFNSDTSGVSHVVCCTCASPNESACLVLVPVQKDSNTGAGD